MNASMADVTHYFQRFGYGPPLLESPPHPDLAQVVVIPCFNEPDLLDGLQSLLACHAPQHPVEVIVVLNSPKNCASEILDRNEQTWAEIIPWMKTHSSPRLRFHGIHAPNLPPKHAGVGLARKIGMDEALRRFAQVGHLEGIIVCLDADSRVDPNYLTAIDSHFQSHPDTPGASVYYEHPLEGPLDPSLYEAAAAYELHLRYYVQALRWAGVPYGYHTVGSSMAARAVVYMKQGGMNRRKAGEDFYFLHKIIALGGFTEIQSTRVIPSPRPSDRVPFGTGKAVRAYLREGRLPTYPWEAFQDIQTLVGHLPELNRSTPSQRREMKAQWSEALQIYLDEQGFDSAVEEMQQHTASEASFRKRFFRWFDAFQAMKFIHLARDRFYGVPEIKEAATSLLARLAKSWSHEDSTIRNLLATYRRLDLGEPISTDSQD